LDTEIITSFKNNDYFKDTIIKRINKLNPKKLNLNLFLANRELNIVNGQNIKKVFYLEKALNQIWGNLN